VRALNSASPSLSSDWYPAAKEQVEHTQMELELERDRAVEAQRVRYAFPVSESRSARPRSHASPCVAWGDQSTRAGRFPPPACTSSP
jgi:hypothetical protein